MNIWAYLFVTVVKMKINGKTGPSGETDPVQVNNCIVTGQFGLI